MQKGADYDDYLRNPSKLSKPFWALNLFGSYSWMRSFARAGLAYGYRISFSLGSRCVLLRKSTNCVVDMIRRFDVPTLQETKTSRVKWLFAHDICLLLEQQSRRVFFFSLLFEALTTNSTPLNIQILTYISSKSFSTSVRSVKFLYKLKKSSNWSFCSGIASVLPIGSPDTSSAFSTRRRSSLCDANSFKMLKSEREKGENYYAKL